MMFFSLDGDKHPFFQSYTRLAERYKRKMSFTLVDKEMLENTLHKSVMDILGIDRRQFP